MRECPARDGGPPRAGQAALREKEDRRKWRDHGWMKDGSDVTDPTAREAALLAEQDRREWKPRRTPPPARRAENRHRAPGTLSSFIELPKNFCSRRPVGQVSNLPDPSMLPHMRLCAYFQTPPRSPRAAGLRCFVLPASHLRRHSRKILRFHLATCVHEKMTESYHAKGNTLSPTYMRFYAVMMRMMRFVLFLVSALQPVRI